MIISLIILSVFAIMHNISMAVVMTLGLQETWPIMGHTGLILFVICTAIPIGSAVTIWILATAKTDKLAEVKKCGFSYNPLTGELSSHCNICGKYAVLNDGCYCDTCAEDHQIASI